MSAPHPPVVRPRSEGIRRASFPNVAARFVIALGVVAASLSMNARPVLADDAAKKPRAPNIVFILADDLGVFDLGCYGGTKIRTPGVDRIAAQGMRFTQAYAGSPVCAPSRCCLMTGKHGGHAWVRSNLATPPEGQTPLPAEEVTIAELLQQSGYKTGAIGKWGLGMFQTEGSPLKQGFDFFFGYNCQSHAHSHYPKYLYRDAERFSLEGNDVGVTGRTHSHELFEQEALAFIKQHHERPFFLFLPFTIPHLALQATPESLAEYRERFEETPYEGKKGYTPHPTPRAAYAAMITRMDRTVGKILDLLGELKLDENTIVMFSSDNGAVFPGIGGSDPEFFQSMGRLRGFKGSVWEGGIRTPLVARWPGKITAGSESSLPCYFPDILPTLLDLTGNTQREPAEIDGLSIAPTLLGKTDQQQKHEFLMWDYHGSMGQQALRMGAWKGIRRGLTKGPAKLELYNLESDPGEAKDVADEHPDIVKRMEKILHSEHTRSELFPLKGLGEPVPENQNAPKKNAKKKDAA